MPHTRPAPCTIRDKMRQGMPLLFKRSHVSHMNVLQGKPKIFQENLRHIRVCLSSRKHFFHHVMVLEDVNFVGSTVFVFCVCLCGSNGHRQTAICPTGAEKQGVRWVTFSCEGGKVEWCWLLSQTYGCARGKWMGVGLLQRPTLLSYKEHAWADAAQSKPPIPLSNLIMKAALAVSSSFKSSPFTSTSAVSPGF